MPISREAKAVGILVAATVGTTTIWYLVNRTKIEKAGGLFSALFGGLPGDEVTREQAKLGEAAEKGYVVCPEEIGRIPPNVPILRGDFVIVHLVSNDGKFVEPTWAQVRSMSPDKSDLYVQLVGEFTPRGIEPLATEKHGFNIGEKMLLDRDCIFDVLHQDTVFTGQVLCGPNLAVIRDETTNKQVYFARDTKGVQQGDAVRIIVASPEAQGTAWHEPIWVRVNRISPTQQVIQALVAETPKLTGQHGLEKMSAVQFGRDCVVEIQ